MLADYKSLYLHPRRYFITDCFFFYTRCISVLVRCANSFVFPFAKI